MSPCEMDSKREKQLKPALLIGENGVVRKPLQQVEQLPIEGIDYVELYVGNAKQAAFFYQNAFGFQPVAYSGPETGVKDKVSYLLQQSDIRLLLTTGLVPDHPASRFVQTHGDGVADIAMRVQNVDWLYKEAVKRGAKGIMEHRVFSAQIQSDAQRIRYRQVPD